MASLWSGSRCNYTVLNVGNRSPTATACGQFLRHTEPLSPAYLGEERPALSRSYGAFLSSKNVVAAYGNIRALKGVRLRSRRARS